VRYIPHSEKDIEQMLQKVGAKSVDELFGQIPEQLRFRRDLDLPAPMSESEIMDHINQLASSPSLCMTSFMGAGAYCHHVPIAADHILLRSEFYTAYTPYQPEVSQGTLQAIFEFQTMICRLLAMDVSNASMYDGATAATEAALMARRVTGRDKIVVSAGLHPEYVEVLETYLKATDADDPIIEMVGIDEETGATDLGALSAAIDGDTACVLAGYPNFFGIVERVDEMARIAHDAGALMITSTAEPFALGAVAPPGDLGVDIATGEGQGLGVPVSYGGPGLGLFAIRQDKKLMRQLPGRLCGQTVDSDGHTGYVLTLATREQHIRREKATSNICTNHGLCALAVGVNLSFLGKVGFEKAAISCLSRGEYLKKEIARIDGFSIPFAGPTFNEFAVRCERGTASNALDKLREKGILGGVDLGRFDETRSDSFLVAVTECHTRANLDAFLKALGEIA
jgi:glycine dehydrogenase subunit 1